MSRVSQKSCEEKEISWTLNTDINVKGDQVDLLFHLSQMLVNLVTNVGNGSRSAKIDTVQSPSEWLVPVGSLGHQSHVTEDCPPPRRPPLGKYHNEHTSFVRKVP